MLDFYGHLWVWLLACLAVGAATGALARRAPARAGPARWLVWTGLAFLAAVASLALGAVQGAAELYVESAVACFAAFVAGAAAAALAGRRSLAAHEGWALGLLPAALFWWGAAFVAQPAYQAKLQTRLAAMAQAAGADATGLTLSGRDVLAPPAVAANRELMALIAGSPGVRRVVVAATPPPVPKETAPEKREPAAAPPQSAPPPAPQNDPRAVLDALPEGPLDAAACQRALDAVAALEPVVFRETRAVVNRRAALALDKAAEVIRRCPDATTIEVRGHGDEVRTGDTLALRRARAAERYLRREGVAGRRLTPVDCCAGAVERRASAIDFIVR